jgi:hypothetical protein
VNLPSKQRTKKHQFEKWLRRFSALADGAPGYHLGNTKSKSYPQIDIVAKQITEVYYKSTQNIQPDCHKWPSQGSAFFIYSLLNGFTFSERIIPE